MESLEYCRQRAVPEGSSRYYAVQAAPARQRPRLTAIHALYVEITRIPLDVSESAVAAVKLNWWREELRRTHKGAASHPVTTALQPLSDEDLADSLALVDGVSMDLTYGGYEDFTALAGYCHATGVPLGRLLGRTCADGADTPASYAHDLGMGLRLQELLLETREHARRGRCYLPEDEMHAAAVGADDLQATRSGASLRALFRQQAHRAMDFLDQAAGRLSPAQRPEQRSNLVLAALYRALLQELDRSDFPLLEEQQQLTPIRRLWIAWRVGRRAARSS